MSRRASSVMIAAAAMAVPLVAQATITPTTVTNPQTFVVSTSGATALGALTRGADTASGNNPRTEQNGLWRLGVSSLQIGRSTYTFGSSPSDLPIPQLISFRDWDTPTSGGIERTVRGSDHIVYTYSEVGSINGVLNTVKSGGIFRPFSTDLGLAAGSPQAQRGPGVPSPSAPLWINGWNQRGNNQFAINSDGLTSTTGANTANNPNGWRPYATAVGPGPSGATTVVQTVNSTGTLGGVAREGQQLSRIGYTDVRTFQTFAVNDISGVASPDRKPRNLPTTGADDRAQYGVGQGAFNPLTGSRGTNFQALANRTEIVGETDNANDSHIRNETLAIVPFAVAANPGTGLTRVDEKEVRFLNGIGRLPNGANFNSVTREIGSGTRNQGANNFNIDPSFAGGERDRRSLNPVAYNDVDVNNNVVTVRRGDEVNPNKDLFGVATSDVANSQQPKEHRVGPLIRFSDKNSGGSGVRPVVVNNRMAITPNLSVGDVGGRGLAGTSDSRTDPLRVLGVKFDFQPGEAGLNQDGSNPGYTQPTAEDVSTGRHQHWSAAQAVTIIGRDSNGDGTFDALGTVGTDTNPNRPILDDTIDHAGSVGIHRKFLNNINGSVSTFGQAVTNVTPADAVIAAGFIPQQIMRNDKDFDGGVQTVRNLSTTPPPGGVGLSEQQLYDAVIVGKGAGTLGARLNWAAPSTINGDLGLEGEGGTYTYKIFAQDVAATGTASTNPTKSIQVKSRTSLAGDLNNDGVRDLQDAAAWGQAFAASQARGDIVGNGSSNLTFAGQTLSSDDLIVLTDLTGTGNISGTNANPVYRAVTKEDARFFLLGASVDTVSANTATGYAGSTNAAVRREDGVRYGKLKKNQAIDTFNAAFLAAGGSLADVIQKADVDGDFSLTLNDAKIVNSLIGVRPYELTLEQLMLGYVIDPIYAELNDDDVISHVFDPATQGPSDFAIVRNALGSKLLDGDVDFSGTVTFGNLGVLLNNYNQNGIWSNGDFNFDGVVDFSDLGLLLNNFGQTAVLRSPLIDVTEYSLSSEAVTLLADKGFTVVPEPSAAVGLIGLAGLSLNRRRRQS